MSAALVVRDLTITSDSRTLVDSVSFEIAEGERVGLIGESGSGKSLTALAIIGLLPEGMRASGSIRLGDREIIGASERALRGVRGRDVAVVFQEPLTALDPLMKLGNQVAEPLRRRAERDGEKMRGAALAAAVRSALEEVRLPEIDRIVSSYPHEISGGQRQRVAPAMALAGRPQLLIADEPTTALDVTIQAEILALFDRLVAERGMSLLFISHDLAVVAKVASRLVVLRDGVAVETGEIGEILRNPQHPYTRDLVASARHLDSALDWELER